MKLKDNSAQEIDTALYQLEQKLKSNIRLTDVENSNASTAKINAVDKKLTEEIKDRQSADEKLQVNINKEIADRKDADAAIENAKQDKLIAGNNIQIDGNIISATPAEYTAEAPVKVTDGKISLDTVPIAKGGTGVTTQADINKAFIGNLEIGNSDVTDGTEFVSSWASDKGFAETTEGALNKPYKRQFIKVWNYIKGKISSVLGLTKDNYGGKSAKSSFLDEYVGAGGTRPTSGNIKPKDATEYGGMRKDVATSSMTDSGIPGYDGHLLTMFWDNGGRYDSQFFVSNNNPPIVKVRAKVNKTDYGTWTDIITSNNIGSQTVANADKANTAGTADSAATILDSNNGTPIKVRWGGSAIDSAEWYPAFNADGSVLGPINRANIHAGTADTVANALTVNGKTYDGSSAVNAGVQTVANGGTGATTAENGFNTLANGVRDSSKPVDNEKMLLKPTQGTWYKTTCLDFWNYIKGKISSVLGLTGKKLTLQGETVSSNSYTDTNPKLEFKNVDGSQNISLTFTDFDAVQAPASLTLNGNQGNEYFIAPNIKVNRNITLDGDGGATLSAYGSEPLTIGFPSGTNGGVSLGFDRNSIQARTNGAASNMYINFYGGMVIINDQNKSNGGLKVKQKLVIPTGVPSPLEDGCIWIS